MNRTCFNFPTTPPGQPVWVANATCRGTFEIISLCLSTTLICIWSSVHRDIPLKRLSSFRSFLRDAPLVLVALFAPELLFYFALNQYLCARGLVSDASKLDSFKTPPKVQNKDGALKRWRTRILDFLRIGERSGRPHQGQDFQDDDIELMRRISRNEISYRQHAFTLTHGFYATMGGFVFFALEEDGSFGKRPVKLTSDGVNFVMEHLPALIPDLSRTSITDRSKSNSLGKALLFVQVMWFCMSCASRLNEHLPLSLLEISTLAHGLFTLSSYAMWWYKPLGIDEPTPIAIPGDSNHSKHAQEVLALMQLLSCDSMLGLEEEESIYFYSKIRGPIGLRPHFTSKRLELALDAINRYGTPAYKHYSTSYTVPPFKHLFVATGYKNVATDSVVMTGIPLIYGILHFLGWHTQFPSLTERHMWQYATIIVMSSGLSTSFFDWLDLMGIRGRLYEPLSKAIRATRNTIMFFILPIPYVCASLYLLVESIRQLWYIPHEAYVDATWSYYIPHWL